MEAEVPAVVVLDTDLVAAEVGERWVAWTMLGDQSARVASRGIKF